MSFPGDGRARSHTSLPPVIPGVDVPSALLTFQDPGRRPSRPRRPSPEAAPAGPVTCCIHLHPAAPTRPVRRSRRRRRRRHFPPRPPASASAPPPPGFRRAAAHVQCPRARAGLTGLQRPFPRQASAGLPPSWGSPSPAGPRS